jgi:hypothetical protein
MVLLREIVAGRISPHALGNCVLRAIIAEWLDPE